VSDEWANAPGAGHRVPVEAPLILVIDRTPPKIRLIRTPDGLRAVVTDDRSSVRSLRWVEDGVVRSTPRPEDGVYDSATEAFRLDIAASTGLLRAEDAAGNTAEVPLGETP